MKISDVRIALIGAGKIAYSLAGAFQNAGFLIDAVISRGKKSAALLSGKFHISFYSDDLKNIPHSVNFFILAVPDSRIEKTAEALSKNHASLNKNIFIHLSGVETIDALRPLKAKGAQTGSIHFMQTFPSKTVVDLTDSHAAIETEDRKLYNFLSAILKQLGVSTFKIDSGKKVLYHLAGVYASNFIVGNIFLAEKLFKSSAGRNNFYKFMKIISESAMKNAFSKGAINSLSGPVERGDKNTVLKHLDALDERIKKAGSKNEAMIIKDNYIAQSIILLQLIYERDGSLSRNHAEIKTILINKLKQ